MISYICPVCGYPDLYAPPTDPGASHQFQICPSCGFQFGYTDDAQGFSFEQWRDLWIARGMVWAGSAHPPEGWDARAQVRHMWPDALMRNHDLLTQYASDGYALWLEGFEVSRCIVDFAFTLHLLRGAQNTFLRIEVPFTCTLRGKHTRCDPERDPASLAPALLLLHRPVEMAFVGQDASLRVVLADQAMLAVPSDPQYEAWTFNGPDGLLIVGGPADRVSVFPSPASR